MSTSIEAVLETVAKKLDPSFTRKISLQPCGGDLNVREREVVISPDTFRSYSDLIPLVERAISLAREFDAHKKRARAEQLADATHSLRYGIRSLLAMGEVSKLTDLLAEELSLH